MRTRRCSLTLTIVLALIAIAGPAGAIVGADPASSAGPRILSHDLTVRLDPSAHRLVAIDRFTLEPGPGAGDLVRLSLSRKLRVTRVESAEASGVEHPFRVEAARSSRDGEDLQTVEIRLSSSDRGRAVTMVWRYEGEINDPPKDAGHLRFVTPSQTSGHIGPEGVYLSGETHWYPDLPGSLPTFRLHVTGPEGWAAVTHGRHVADTPHDGVFATEWDIASHTEALTLVANRFAVKRREWNGIEVATYLFPNEAALADEYLDASIRYLDAYAKLLGPYPFPKFAVVENFFASGLGMPSFTLLGSGVVKRHYTQPYALGHEIVHSWIGNSVFNRPEEGNWIEGLTTYLANYYYDELTGHSEKAREERRMMLLGYAVYVRPEEDYPLSRFHQKTDQKDNAIGYQKAAMVFHMLRREIGDEAFWRGLRRLAADYAGAYATWQDLERVFERSSGTSLRPFFAEWIERAGAPRLAVAKEVEIQKGRDGRSYDVTMVLSQMGEPYRLQVPAAVTLAGGGRSSSVLVLDQATQRVTLTVPDRPIRLQLDPDFEIFRRLNREDLVPMLNLYATDPRRFVVIPPAQAGADAAPYEELGKQIAARDPQAVLVKNGDERLQRGSVLVLGGPGINPAADWAIQNCGNDVEVARDSFSVGGRTYRGQDMAVLVSCRRLQQQEAVMTVFYGLSPQSAEKVSRLLFFYGWHSYLVFRDGQVVARGDFPAATDKLEVRLEAH